MNLDPDDRMVARKRAFYETVDRIFLHVLLLLERIKNKREVDPEQERDEIVRRLEDAESKLGKRDDWKLTQYALVAWIDEMLCTAPWGGNDWWLAHSLEMDLHKERIRAHEFFERAHEASTESKLQALECYYIAVVLGFRGAYRSREAFEEEAKRLSFDLPSSLEDWASKIWIKLRRNVAFDAPKIDSRLTDVPGVPAREGKHMLIGASVIAFVLAVVNLMLWIPTW